jgi:hypothetical protein
MKHMFLASALIAGCFAGPALGTALAQAPAGTPFERADYANPDLWLCRPGIERDICAAPPTITQVDADGTLTPIEAVAAQDPPIDCFYLYPTISQDKTPNSDLTRGAFQEGFVTSIHAAPLSESCRVFAPMYRQVPVPELLRFLATGTSDTNLEMRHADVLDAWSYYLEHDNNGRGVVLIGHSQGANMVQELWLKDIAQSPARQLVVSLMPIGFTTHLNADTGTFGGLPPCQTAEETGCLIAYSAFRADAPPPPHSLFGIASSTGERAACTSPAALLGKSELDARLIMLSSAQQTPFPLANGERVNSVFVSLPGMISAECRQSEQFDYLAVTVNADPGDARADDIPGDYYAEGVRLDDWGLHLIDLNLALGDLIAIIARQGEAWTSKASPTQARAAP